jgi:hypothetical protein
MRRREFIAGLGGRGLNRWPVGRVSGGSRMIKPTALALFATTTAWQGYAADIQIVAGKVYLTGELAANDGPVFQAQSADLPLGTTLVLKSMGGSIQSAFRIGEVVWTKHFTTFVPRYCLSACALVWLVGSPRRMSPGGIIGFHQARNGDGNAVIWVNRAVTRYLESKGYGTEVQQFALSAPPSGMAYLTKDQIRRLGIDVQIVPSGDRHHDIP